MMMSTPMRNRKSLMFSCNQRSARRATRLSALLPSSINSIATAHLRERHVCAIANARMQQESAREHQGNRSYCSDVSRDDIFSGTRSTGGYGEERASHRNIMNMIVETIRQLAPRERVCVFVMCSSSCSASHSFFFQLTNRLKVCVPSGQSGGHVARSIQRCAMPRLIFVY